MLANLRVSFTAGSFPIDSRLNLSLKDLPSRWVACFQPRNATNIFGGSTHQKTHLFRCASSHRSQATSPAPGRPLHLCPALHSPSHKWFALTRAYGAGPRPCRPCSIGAHLCGRTWCLAGRPNPLFPSSPGNLQLLLPSLRSSPSPHTDAAQRAERRSWQQIAGTSGHKVDGNKVEVCGKLKCSILTAWHSMWTI